MNGWAQHLPEFMSLSDLSRKVSATVERLVTGRSEQVVILRHNEPAAVLMSTERYESLINLIEKLERAEDKHLLEERLKDVRSGHGLELEKAFSD